MTPNNIPNNLWRWLLVGLLASLLANGGLFWAWRNERQQLTTSLQSSQQQLSLSGRQNRRLAKENSAVKSDLTEKDAELASKIKELATKEDELTTLIKQLEDKKKEVDLKQKEVEAKQKELADAQKQLNDQKSQLETNAAELAKLRNRPPLFSFQNKSSKLSDIEAKKSAVRRIVTDSYDVIQELYGKPYLLHSVTISFVDQFSNAKASGEIVITNSDKGLDLEIRLKDFDETKFSDINTVIHEVVHSFHGLAVLEPTAFEEGIAVAITDAVMKRLTDEGKIPRFSSLYIQLSEAEYQDFQAKLTIPRDSKQFYAAENVAEYYQVLGNAWYKLYEADANFFKTFNELIYAKKSTGVEITEAIVMEAVKTAAPAANLSGAAWQLK